MWIAIALVGGVIIGMLVMWWLDVRFWRSAVPSAEQIAARKKAEKSERQSERQMLANEIARHALEVNALEEKLEQQATALHKTQQALDEQEQRNHDLAEEFAAALAEAKAATPEAPATPAVEAPKPKSDQDLQFINGIGPKVKETLNKAGILSFADLAKKTAAQLQEILDNSSGRFRLTYPDTWPKQAALLRDGQYQELQDYLQVERDAL